MEDFKYGQLIELIIDDLNENPNFDKMREVIQHGKTTVYEHSVKVAYLSCKIAYKLKADIDYKSLIRGALLHDYFLYDRKDNIHEGFHGFTHAKAALNNAKRDYRLNNIEKDTILRHMFPLNIIPPKYKESWIVCLADTLSAASEFVSGYREKIFKGKEAYSER